MQSPRMPSLSAFRHSVAEVAGRSGRFVGDVKSTADSSLSTSGIPNRFQVGEPTSLAVESPT
jgi:hypothetical protein